MAIFLKVKNKAIFNRVDQVTTDTNMFTKTTQNGVETISVTSLQPLLSQFKVPVTLSPTLAQSGDYLILTSSEKLLQDIIAVQTGKKSGFKSTAEFKKLSQGIPADGNNFTLLSEKFGKSFSKAMQAVAAASPMGAQSATLQDMMASNAVACSFSVGVNGPEGWVSSGNGSQSFGATAMLLPAAATVGLLSAIAIPNFVKARATAQDNVCINNLRMIDSAKGQWAIENHKKNTDTPAWDDLKPYLSVGPNATLPVCPQGGAYIIGAIADKPRCTIPGHVLP
jgi:competence protein ComGC